MNTLLKYKLEFVADTKTPTEVSKNGAHRIGRICYLEPGSIKEGSCLIAVYEEYLYFQTTKIKKITEDLAGNLLTITTKNSIYTFRKID